MFFLQINLALQGLNQYCDNLIMTNNSHCRSIGYIYVFVKFPNPELFYNAENVCINHADQSTTFFNYFFNHKCQVVTFFSFI